VRRREVPLGDVPEQLVRFVASEWPGDELDGFEQWLRARFDYAQQNPDGPFGDVLDELKRRRDVKRAGLHVDNPSDLHTVRYARLAEALSRRQAARYGYGGAGATT
jgi:hypothetical protein